MRELSFEDAKIIELNILRHIDDFCNKNNLKYFLAYGTLIGAVRHKGFIPWDDDIDITLPREDYNWLIENFNKINDGGRYKLVSPYSKGAKHPYVKIIDTFTVKIEAGVNYHNDYLGVDVDVFPMDGQPESKQEFDRWFNRLMRIYKLHAYCLMETNGSLKRKIFVPIIRMLTGGHVRLAKKVDKLHKKYTISKSNYVGVTSCLFVNRGDRFRKECISGCKYVSFEGYEFPIPIGYDEILTNIYGDYMKLPPEEKRVTHHANKMYIKDNVEIY